MQNIYARSVIFMDSPKSRHETCSYDTHHQPGPRDNKIDESNQFAQTKHEWHGMGCNGAGVE